MVIKRESRGRVIFDKVRMRRRGRPTMIVLVMVVVRRRSSNSQSSRRSDARQVVGWQVGEVFGEATVPQRVSFVHATTRSSEQATDAMIRSMGREEEGRVRVTDGGVVDLSRSKGALINVHRHRRGACRTRRRNGR